jgi:hypothetical protein
MRIYGAEYNNIHQFVDSEDKPIKIGQLEFDDGVDISLGINKLFAIVDFVIGNLSLLSSFLISLVVKS